MLLTNLHIYFVVDIFFHFKVGSKMCLYICLEFGKPADELMIKLLIPRFILNAYVISSKKPGLNKLFIDLKTNIPIMGSGTQNRNEI